MRVKGLRRDVTKDIIGVSERVHVTSTGKEREEEKGEGEKKEVGKQEIIKEVIYKLFLATIQAR